MDKLKFNFEKFKFRNPCKQLDTSSYNIFRNSLNLSQNADSVFSKECVDVFRDNDYLFQDYNPNEIENSSSSQVADNFNESSKSSENAA